MPKQNVTIFNWLNGEMDIYFNGQEIKFNHLEDKPGKNGYKSRKVAKDHPWSKMKPKDKRQ